MTVTKPKITWKSVVLPVVGLVAFFLYLYFFNVDIPEIIAIAQHIDVSVYFLAIITVLFETFFFSLSWYFLVTFLSVKLSIVRAFMYVWYGIYIDIIIPAESISGEVSRVYLIEREQIGTTGKVVASVVVQRLMGMAINVMCLLLGVSVLILQERASGTLINLTLLLTAVITVFLVLLILLCFKEAWTLKIVEGGIRLIEFLTRGHWKLTRIKDEVIKMTRMFHGSIKEYGHAPKSLSLSLVFNVLSWLLSFGVAYLVFLSMRFPISWSVIVVTCSIIVAIQSIPLGIPFEAGLPEITMASLFQWLTPNMTMDIAATATILIRILTVWLRFFIGFAVQQWLEIKAITTKKMT
ncbi:MAG: lysylphosphatidylglycerol synthase transmembrane domain-containing protein [Candidatus Bathyarchaeia archaeon]|nr:flippase-like domain-containing protein [Candidatus Bathyarchaeota archaeon A05DMB-5]